jgi:hypothetical protein
MHGSKTSSIALALRISSLFAAFAGGILPQGPVVQRERLPLYRSDVRYSTRAYACVVKDTCERYAVVTSSSCVTPPLQMRGGCLSGLSMQGISFSAIASTTGTTTELPNCLYA